jgi:hypothetical protein
LPHDGLFIPGASNVIFTLSLHEDFPDMDGPGPGFSKPTNLVWFSTFGPGSGPFTFTTTLYAGGIREGFLTPPGGLIPSSVPGDTNCYKYEFTIPLGELLQQGTPTSPRVYWLDVQARFLVTQTNGPTIRPQFGWKTTTNHWNDDAVWALAVEPTPVTFAAWSELRYPPGHAWGGQSIDLAFCINGRTAMGQTPKWSQPPVSYQNPTNLFNGWDEPSIYQGGFWEFGPITNIVADDWLCTDSRRVSDIHWWGSFLNWRGTNLPPLPPASFHFAIWKDVPAGVDTNFSHPAIVVWDHMVPLLDPALTGEWVGWDVDPRSDCPAVESTFKFHYDIPEPLWFDQDTGTNIYWLSISAFYPGGQLGQHPFGWKTRPHVPIPPDDAVRIFDPIAPVLGSPYISGQPIEFPMGTSWDMAFQLTTCEQLPLTNITITNITVANIPGNQAINIFWNSQPGVYYQIQQATSLSNTPVPWSNVSLLIAGPVNQFALTNPAVVQRYYRIAQPNICP